MRSYPVDVQDGEIFVNVHETHPDPVGHRKRRLSESLKQNISLVIAKAVIALRSHQTDGNEIAEIGARYGALRRRQGWEPALQILTCMANVVPKLTDEGDGLCRVD